MSPAAPSQPAAVFAALGDPTRLGLVARLCAGGPLSIARLTEGTDVTRQAVTKHLRVLSKAGLVHGTRLGREHVWELETRKLEAARRYLDLVSQRWDAALDRLKRAVEDSVRPTRPARVKQSEG
jgi:DNA-binding transcriptional ArsR family regulator